MQQILLGTTGVHCSELSFGTGTPHVDRKSEQVSYGIDLTELLRSAYDQGITSWDTSPEYMTYGRIKKALEGIGRSNVTISTCISSNKVRPGPVRRDLENSLKRLGTDYIDIILLDCGSGILDWSDVYAKAMDILSQAKEDGLVRALGILCNDYNVLRGIANNPLVDVVMVALNCNGMPKNIGNGDINNVFTEIHNAGKGIIAMDIYCGGYLASSDKLKRESMKYVINVGCIDSITIGMLHEDEILENIRLYDGLKNS